MDEWKIRSGVILSNDSDICRTRANSLQRFDVLPSRAKSKGKPTSPQLRLILPTRLILIKIRHVDTIFGKLVYHLAEAILKPQVTSDEHWQTGKGHPKLKRLTVTVSRQAWHGYNNSCPKSDILVSSAYHRPGWSYGETSALDEQTRRIIRNSNSWLRL